MRAAAVQLQSTPDRERNLEAADRLTREAAKAGAELVVLPEKWPVLGTPEQTVAGAEPLDGPTLQWASATARELGIDLVAGSIAERVEGRERGSNTSVHVGPDGSTPGVYRKIHMFDVEVGGQVYRESEHEAPGDEVIVSETAGGVELGLTVCYDLRFPELYRILAVRGARVLTVAAAFTLATTREHWEILLRARAIENQAFVVAANQVGEHAPGYRSGGRSMIVDPWGIVLAQAPDAETFVIAELDLERQAEVRRTLPSLANRRPEAYRWPQEVSVS
jgi:deaminated glutathione amidase